MSLYEGFKDVISVAQKADNVELYKQLLDLSAEALDMQNQLYQLTQENIELKRQLSEEDAVIRHTEGNYITLLNDALEIQYCSTCWGKEHKLIQLREECEERKGLPRCPICFDRLLSARNSGK